MCAYTCEYKHGAHVVGRQHLASGLIFHLIEAAYPRAFRHSPVSTSHLVTEALELQTAYATVSGSIWVLGDSSSGPHVLPTEPSS